MSELEEAALRVALQLLGDTLDNDDPELQEAMRQLRALVARRYGRVVLESEVAPWAGQETGGGQETAGGQESGPPRDVVIGLGPLALSGRATS